ncbi:Rap1a/Tai family immunity protein [Comamonas sp. MYb21]|uniref:Rap1a/Tai family immunity protein n=1 Tax=Comamonas sp. MYb21 TaxID=1848648 RepID=UPI00309B1549
MFNRLAPILLLLTCRAANAYTGNELYTDLRELRKITDGQPSKAAINVGKATGYVQGLRDMGDVIGLFCTPNQAPLSQVIDVVFVYLEKNPKDRHDTALILINHALVKAFPCPAKK